MRNRPVLESQQSKKEFKAAQGPAGCWALLPHQALSLRPTHRARLRIGQGGAWITEAGEANAIAQDVFLSEGDAYVFEAGSHVVIESWEGGRTVSRLPLKEGAGVRFRWDPLPAPERAQAQAWDAGVAAPWAELLDALRGAVGAGGRLAQGLVLWAAGSRWKASPAPRACIDAQCE